jgi:hypothetical protein
MHFLEATSVFFCIDQHGGETTGMLADAARTSLNKFNAWVYLIAAI